MTLRQLSLDTSVTLPPRNSHADRGNEDEPAEPHRAEPARRLSQIGDSVSDTAQRGAFPFSTSDHPNLATTATSSTGVVSRNTQNQKRKEEAENSEDQPEAKRPKTSDSAEVDVSGQAGAVDSTADEAEYEPQPKRRKSSHSTLRNININFESDDENFADDEAETGDSDTDDSDDSDVESSDAKETDTGDKGFATEETDSDDDTFVAEEETDTDDSSNGDCPEFTPSEEDVLTPADDSEDTLMFASSSTAQSISSPSLSATFPSNAGEALRSAYLAPNQPTRCSITRTDMSLFPPEVQRAWPYLGPRTDSQAARHRRLAEITIYEDETATPPGWVGAWYTDIRGGVTTSDDEDGGLSTLDRGQENRQPPARPEVEAPINTDIFLVEGGDGGDSDEEVRIVSDPEATDVWPFYHGDGMYE